MVVQLITKADKMDYPAIATVVKLAHDALHFSEGSGEQITASRHLYWLVEDLHRDTGTLGEFEAYCQGATEAECVEACVALLIRPVVSI